jgi:hypothetical protein
VVRKLRLEVGDTCTNGHEILSEADLKIYRERRKGVDMGRTRHSCRACSKKKQDNPEERRQILMNCGHDVYFRPQWPKVNDLILCRLCSGYRVVTEVRREDEALSSVHS